MTSRLALVLCAALAVPGLACREKTETPPASAPAAPALAPAPRPDFGGGYKGTKWGESPAEVEQRFGKPIATGAAPHEPDLVREQFAVGDAKGKPTPKRIEAFFWNGQLVRAVLAPHFTDDYAPGYDETYRALTAKYGPGTPVTGQKDPRTGALVDLIAWTDGTTLIQLRVDRLPTAAAKAQKKTDPRRFSTTQVIYTSIPLAQARAHATQAMASPDAATPAPDAGR